MRRDPLAAVLARLTKGRATRHELMDATGFKKNAVDRALAKLREQGHPAIANLHRLRAEPGAGPRPRIRLPVVKPPPQPPRPRTKTLLERAWMGQL